MKKAQGVGTVRERERERELHSSKKKCGIVRHSDTHTSNFLVKPQAKIFSFVSATIKTNIILKDRLYVKYA